MCKRLIDVAVAAFALTVLSIPLLMIGGWIKVDSRGPVFFRQSRVGRNGREFRILKFRTMYPSTPEGGPLLTVGPDPRITRAGVHLRRFKLDELPQLWNVLTGDMSLVGPRPEVPRYVAKYPPAVREVVLSVRPGITDNASIAFVNESDLLSRSSDPERTYIEEVLPVKLRYYMEYVRARSFAVDVKIVIRTALAILSRR